MDQPSHSYGLAGTNEVGAIDRNRPGGSGEPPLPAFRRALALRRGGFTLAKQRDPESIRGFTLVETPDCYGNHRSHRRHAGWMLGSLMSSATHATQRVDAFRRRARRITMIERDFAESRQGQWSPDPFTNPTPAPCAASAISNHPCNTASCLFLP